MRKEIFIVRSRITLQAAILNCPEAAVHIHPFSKISPENTGGRVLLLVNLQTDCSEWQLSTKMTPQVQKQPPTVIHFRKFLQEIPVVEPFF